MKHNVIVIDDQFADRLKGYKFFEKKVSELVSGFEISLDFVKEPNRLRLMAQRNHYSAAIVDAVLEGNWPHFTISRALRDLGDEIPIALLSERWDKTNSEQIDDAWKKPNCRTFLHWRDIDPSKSGQIDYAVRAFVSMLSDREKLDIEFKLDPIDPIRILHISDVQTGGFDEKTLKLEANRCADLILQRWDDCSPTFVAVTGDLAEHGDPTQYQSSFDWMSYFFARLHLGSLPARNLLYVPGNHDVNLCLAAASRVHLTVNGNTGEYSLTLGDDMQQAELLAYAYTPFHNFLRRIGDCPLLSQDINDHSLAWVESRYRHLGVIFYGVNTAQPVNAYGLPDRRVDPNALAQIGAELSEIVPACGENPPLVIGLGHHCPVSAGADSAVVNPEDFDKFFRSRVKTGLFLHGHVHDHDLSYGSNDSLRLVRSCATTLTKKEGARPSDSLRGFNTLELHRENHVVKGLSAFSFGWVGSDIKELKRAEWTRQDDGMFREK